MLDLAPKYLRLEKEDGTVIKDLENGKTLSQLNFTTDEVLTAYKIFIEENIQEAPLIGPDGKITDRAR